MPRWDDAIIPDLQGEALDDWINWRLTDPRYFIPRGDNMPHRQWTIEFRCNVPKEGAEKIVAAINEIARSTALHAYACLTPFAKQEGSKPQVTAFSEDFVHTRRDIELFVQQGNTPLTQAVNEYADKVVALEVDDELLREAQKASSGRS